MIHLKVVTLNQSSIFLMNSSLCQKSRIVFLFVAVAMSSCSKEADPAKVVEPSAPSAPSAPNAPSAPSAVAAPAAPPAIPSPFEWADVIEPNPDPKIVTDADALQRIIATGLPWKIRDKKSGIELLLVPSGTFTMGLSVGDIDGQNSEKPAHQVSITKAFYLGRTEVTQLQWERQLNSNPSSFFDPQLPVQRVEFGDVTRFLDATGFRLPTEAEWEYACRAGSDQARYGDLEIIARYQGNSKSQPGIVGQRPANEWGFHDMLGNAMEWCSDYFQADYYSQCKSEAKDPMGPSQGKIRVTRGGSWAGIAKMSRASYRYGVAPDYRGDFLGDGLRVARNP